MKGHTFHSKKPVQHTKTKKMPTRWLLKSEKQIIPRLINVLVLISYIRIIDSSNKLLANATPLSDQCRCLNGNGTLGSCLVNSQEYEYCDSCHESFVFKDERITANTVSRRCIPKSEMCPSGTHIYNHQAETFKLNHSFL